MEKLQGPINPCLIAEELEVGNWLDEFISSTTKFEDSYNTEEGGCYYYGESPHYTLPSLEDKMPFLQMLQTVESSHHHHHHHHHHQHHQHQHQHQQHHQHHQQSSFPLMQFEPNFQFLLKLQHPKLTCFSSSTTTTTLDDHHLINHTHMISNINDNNVINNGVKSETRSKTSNNINNNNNNHNDNDNDGVKKEGSIEIKGVKEKRKRKRTTTRVVKNKEEVENQRMTHIAVERNRRRQMNEHLSALRSLMPPSYAQRGDQASIIGGAIDFVKELEQMLQSLQAQKKMRQSEEKVDVSRTTSTTTTTTTSSSSNMFMDSSFPFHESRNPIPSHEEGNGKGNGNGNENENGIVLEGNGVRKSCNEEFSAEKKSALADIEVVVIQNHVNLKIQCQRRPGQLLKAIVAFEELRLTVLHLNITSLHSLVHYSFNLKIEDDCKLGSADDVARAVHQIFSFINLN